MPSAYTVALDRAQFNAEHHGVRFPHKVLGCCSHCGEPLTPSGHHRPKSNWEDGLCRSIISSYGDTLQFMYENRNYFPFNWVGV